MRRSFENKWVRALAQYGSFIILAFGIFWLFVHVHGNLKELGLLFGMTSQQLWATNVVGFLLLGCVYAFLVAYLEEYLNAGAKNMLLWPRVRQVVIIEIAALVISYGITVLVQFLLSR